MPWCALSSAMTASLDTCGEGGVKKPSLYPDKEKKATRKLLHQKQQQQQDFITASPPVGTCCLAAARTNDIPLLGGSRVFPAHGVQQVYHADCPPGGPLPCELVLHALPARGRTSVSSWQDASCHRSADVSRSGGNSHDDRVLYLAAASTEQQWRRPGDWVERCRGGKALQPTRADAHKSRVREQPLV